MSELVGKVVAVLWQDIWWSTEEKHIDQEFDDANFLHLTYGLVLQSTEDFLRLSHEWRPLAQTHCGTTSIPWAVIKELRVYGDGETASEEGEGAGPASPGCCYATEQGDGDGAEPGPDTSGCCRGAADVGEGD